MTNAQFKDFIFNLIAVYNDGSDVDEKDLLEYVTVELEDGAKKSLG